MSAVAASGNESTFGGVFVTNLDATVDNKKLFETFCVYGTMISCNVVLDQNGASKGFAFVYFETQEAAQKAILEANGMMVAGKKIVVAKCQSREERAQKTNEGFKATNLFIKNIDDSFDDEDLKKVFAPFGAIKSAKVMRHESGLSKGFGFVSFEKADDANRALNVMNLKNVGSKPLFVSIAQSKEDRLAQLASRTEQRGDGEVQGRNGGASPQREAEGRSVPATFSARRRQFSPEPVVSARPQTGLGRFAQDRVEAPEIVYGLIKNLRLEKEVETIIIATLLEQDDQDLIRMARDIQFFDSMVEEAKTVLGLSSMNHQQRFMQPIRI